MASGARCSASDMWCGSRGRRERPRTYLLPPNEATPRVGRCPDPWAPAPHCFSGRVCAAPDHAEGPETRNSIEQAFIAGIDLIMHDPEFSEFRHIFRRTAGLVALRHRVPERVDRRDRHDFELAAQGNGIAIQFAAEFEQEVLAFDSFPPLRRGCEVLPVC